MKKENIPILIAKNMPPSKTFDTGVTKAKRSNMDTILRKGFRGIYLLGLGEKGSQVVQFLCSRYHQRTIQGPQYDFVQQSVRTAVHGSISNMK